MSSLIEKDLTELSNMNYNANYILSVDYGSYPQHWLLFDRIVQQIILQSESNETGLIRNPDVAPIEINVKEIVHLLAKEEELVAARKKAEELERENSDMSTRLAKKEQELDLRTQEKVYSKAFVLFGIIINLLCYLSFLSYFFPLKLRTRTKHILNILDSWIFVGRIFRRNTLCL